MITPNHRSRQVGQPGAWRLAAGRNDAKVFSSSSVSESHVDAQMAIRWCNVLFVGATPWIACGAQWICWFHVDFMESPRMDKALPSGSLNKLLSCDAIVQRCIQQSLSWSHGTSSICYWGHGYVLRHVKTCKNGVPHWALVHWHSSLADMVTPESPQTKVCEEHTEKTSPKKGNEGNEMSLKMPDCRGRPGARSWKTVKNRGNGVMENGGL